MLGRIALAVAMLTLVAGVLDAAYAAAGGPTDATTVPEAVPVPGDGLQCGKDRWGVKTLSDPEAGAVNLLAQDTTVIDLGDKPKPGVPIGYKLPRLPAGHQAYTIRQNWSRRPARKTGTSTSLSQTSSVLTGQ